MAETSSFFNSLNHDRQYKAEDWADYFSALISNGVFGSPSSGLQVIVDSGMSVTLKAGRAWINGYYYRNSADLALAIPTADGVLKRIDRIVIKWDLTNRVISAAVKSGTPSANPSPPTLQRNADAYELAVADVLVNAGATTISQANITDQRQNNAVCGLVVGLVNQIDTSSLFAQFTAAFDAWFADLQETLDESTAGNIYNMISGTTEHATLTATGWSGETAPFVQVLNITGMTAECEKVRVGLEADATTTVDVVKAEGEAMIKAVTQGNGTLTFKAYGKKPTINLPIYVWMEG